LSGSFEEAGYMAMTNLPFFEKRQKKQKKKQKQKTKKKSKKKPKFKHFPKKPSRPCWIYDRPSEQVHIKDFDSKSHRSKTNLNVLK